MNGDVSLLSSLFILLTFVTINMVFNDKWTYKNEKLLLLGVHAVNASL